MRNNTNEKLVKIVGDLQEFVADNSQTINDLVKVIRGMQGNQHKLIDLLEDLQLRVKKLEESDGRN